MNDTDQAKIDDGFGEDYDGSLEVAAYPEHPANPHNHRFTLSYDPTKPPFLVVRANTAAELGAALGELEESGLYAAMGAAWGAMKAQMAVGAGLGQATPVRDAPAPVQAAPQPTAPPPGVGPAYNPQMPPPGLPGTAPAPWQNVGAPPAPPAQQWGEQQGGGGNGKPQPKPCPPGWYRTDKSSNPEHWKAKRSEHQQQVKGQISWGGGSTFWVSPQAAGLVQSWGFPVVAA